MPVRFSENLTISCRLLSKFGIFVKTDYVRERKEEEHER